MKAVVKAFDKEGKPILLDTETGKQVVENKPVTVPVSSYAPSGSATPLETVGDSVKLSNGDYVSKESYEALSESDRYLLNTLGIDEFNKQKQLQSQQQQGMFESNNVRLDTGEFVSKVDWDKLAPEEQSKLKTLGTNAYNEALKRESADIAANYLKLNTGEYISKEDYNNLSLEDQATLMSKGISYFNELQATQQAGFEANNVKLLSGEWVKKEFYDTLATEDKNYLFINGLDKYKLELERRQTEFESQNVKLSTNEWVSKDFWNTLSESDRSKLNSIGIERFNETIKQNVAEIQANSIQLFTGEYVSREEYNKLPVDEQNKLSLYGVDGYNKYLESKNYALPDGKYIDRTELNKIKDENPVAYSAFILGGFDGYYKAIADAENKIKPYLSVDDKGEEVVDINRYLKEHQGLYDVDSLTLLGYNQADIWKIKIYNGTQSDWDKSVSDADAKDALPDLANIWSTRTAKEKFQILQSRGVISEAAVYGGANSRNEPLVHTNVVTRTFTTLKHLDWKEVALNTVPVLGTVRSWNKMGNTGKAVSIAFDVLSIIPILGAIGAGARAIGTVGRTARFVSAAKAGISAVGRELLAPVQMVLHPVATAKSAYVGLRDILENVGDIKKIPEAVMTTSSHTIKMSVSAATSEAEAIKIRDTLMDLVIKGEKPVIEVNGVRYELSTSKFMDEVKGGVAHATPEGKAFEQGLIVKENRNPATGELMPSKEQGLFVGNVPFIRFAKTSAKGVQAESPAIIITSGETAKKAIATDKVYHSKVEMELKYPIGTEIPAPIQKLYTRLGGMRTEVFLDKELTKAQILKLKLFALVEDLKAPFKPAITVGGDVDNLKSIDNIDDAERVAEELRLSGNDDVARTFLTAYRNRAYLSDVSRGDIIETGEIRYIDSNGRAVTQQVEVRASGTPREDIRVPRNDTDATYSREGIPNSVRTAGRVTRALTSPETRISTSDRIRASETETRAASVDTRRVPADNERVVSPDERRASPEERRVVPPDERRVVPEERRVVPPDERIIPPVVRRVITPEEPYVPPDTRYNASVPESNKKKWEGGEIPSNTITTKLGTPRGAPEGMWYLLPPPYTQEYYTTEKPVGIKIDATGKGSAEKTLQIINENGELQNFQETVKDIGISKLRIFKNDEGKLAVEFMRDEEEAYKGKPTREDMIAKYRKQYLKQGMRKREYQPRDNTKYKYTRVPVESQKSPVGEPVGEDHEYYLPQLVGKHEFNKINGFDLGGKL